MDVHKKQHVSVLRPEHLVLRFVLNIEVYVIDKTWCEYEHDQTTDYTVNPGLIMSKTPVNKGWFNIVAYTEQRQATGCVDNS